MRAATAHFGQKVAFLEPKPPSRKTPAVAAQSTRNRALHLGHPWNGAMGCHGRGKAARRLPSTSMGMATELVRLHMRLNN